MYAAALVGALPGGVAAARLVAALADRFAPPRGARRRFGLLELLMTALLAGVVARFDVGWNMVPPLVAAVSLVPLAVIDLRSGRLPDAITFPASALSLTAVGAVSIATGRPGAVVAAAAAAAGYGTVMWIAHELRPSSLGFGDVKLSPLLGLHIGWAAAAFHGGWLAVVNLAAQALILSCLIGLGMGLAMDLAPGLLRRRRDQPQPAADRTRGLQAGTRLLDTAFPFGPALAAGTMIVVLFSESLPV